LIGVFSLDAKNQNTGINGTNKPGQNCLKMYMCDWMILKRQKTGEFELTHKIRADGIEIIMGFSRTNRIDWQQVKKRIQKVIPSKGKRK
jgi:phage-related protein